MAEPVSPPPIFGVSVLAKENAKRQEKDKREISDHGL